MSHLYISIIAGVERLRAGFGPERYTAGWHHPINKIFGAILTHGLAETMGKILLLNIERVTWKQFLRGRRKMQSSCRVEEERCGGFPIQEAFLSQGFPSSASRNCLQRGMATSHGNGEGHGKLPSKAATKHPKGKYCLHARLLFFLLVLLLYGNICQVIVFDFCVFTAAEGKQSFMTPKPSFCSPNILLNV